MTIANLYKMYYYIHVSIQTRRDWHDCFCLTNEMKYGNQDHTAGKGWSWG